MVPWVLNRCATVQDETSLFKGVHRGRRKDGKPSKTAQCFPHANPLCPTVTLSSAQN